MNKNIVKFFDLKVGDKLIYGAGDPENAIDCQFINVDKVTENGELIIHASCEGGTIIANNELFTIAQKEIK